MSKRGATHQLSKEGAFFGDGSNQFSGDEAKPRKATAAQLANRKLKPLKGRPRVAGSASSSQSFPPASQQQTGSNATTSFSPTPPSGGFTFSAGPSAPFTFSQQNASANNNSTSGTGFSSSFTFGSNNSASNPFSNLAPAPASNSFGNAPSSSTPSNNMFGTTAPSSAPSNGTPSNNIFSAPSSTPTNMFGGSNTNSSSTNNVFAANSTAPSSNIFGATSSAPPTSNIFASATSATPTSNLFGASTSANTAQFGATASSPSTNIFANSTPASAADKLTQSPSSSIFAPAASPAPTNNLFASTATSSSPSSNLFGNMTSSAPESSNIFGGATTSSVPSNNMFSGATTSSAPSNNAFGSATTSSAPSNIFSSSTTASAPSNMFSDASTSSAPSKNMFSSSATVSAPSNNIFGGATTSSAPSNNMFSNSATSSAPSKNIFGGFTSTSSSNTSPATNTAASESSSSIFTSSTQAGPNSSSQTPKLFTQTSESAPQTNIFNFGAQPAANSHKETSESTPANGGQQQSSTSNSFSQPTSGFQLSSSGTNLFGSPTQSPSKPITQTTTVTNHDHVDDAAATTEDALSKPSSNLFIQPSVNASSQIGSNLFGSTTKNSDKPGSNAPTQTGTHLFGLATQSTPKSAESKPQEDAQNNTESQSSTTASLFAKAAAGSTTQLSSPGQTSTSKPDKSAGATSGDNTFSMTAPSSSSFTNSTASASTSNTNGTLSAKKNSNVQLSGSKPTPSEFQARVSEAVRTANLEEVARKANLDLSKVDLKKIELARKYQLLDKWYKKRVAEVPEGESCLRVAKLYFKLRKQIANAYPEYLAAQPTSTGKRKADDDLDTNGVSEAGSPKKSKTQPSQGDSSAASASNTANIFNSIVNKPAQSPLRNVESATSPSAEAAPSNNIFSASTSSPLKFGTNGGTSSSTTPAGSPAKPSVFSQSPVKAPVFSPAGTTTAGESKRKADDISSDEQEEESQDDATQKEKRQKTSPPVSTADTGSVLNSRQASPDARNPFGHLSQDESNKDDEDDESDDDANDEQGSTTPKATPVRTDGLFGRITKDDTPSGTDPKTPEAGGLFSRITGSSTETSKSATANPFGFPAANYEIPGGAKTGPVLKTWNGDSSSPIKFGSPQPTPTDKGNKDTASASSLNPFAGIAASSSPAPSAIFKFTPAPTPASDSSLFKFNPTTTTPSGTSSILGSGLGSRATTPGLSTGASENETSAAENDDEEEAQPVDKEQIALRTALTEEDKKTYEVLFDTDSHPVVIMRLVNKTEEELKANPGKGTTKFESQGKGPLRVLKHKESGGVSILFKSEPLGRVLINTRVQPKFQYKRAKAKLASIPVPDGQGKILQTYLKFEDDEECTKFVDVCVKNQPS